MRNEFASLLRGPLPILAMAPMQDITDRRFWPLVQARGGADVYFTEYFRVYPGSHLSKHILASVTEDPTGRPVIAQMIGNDIPSLVRTVRELERYPVAGIDLNLGCPAPIVYKKCAGGGLLRDPQHIDRVLGALRETVTTHFTVKTRLGFDSPAEFDTLLPIFARHSLDLITIHGRTVRDMYRGEVRYDLIGQAASFLRCPVIANGNIHSAVQAIEVLGSTGARGLMLGRGAVRNPWLFAQIREQCQGLPITRPTGRQVLQYVRELHLAACSIESRDASQVQRLKKFMNFLGAGVDADGKFLHRIQRVNTMEDFFRVCEEFLSHDEPMTLEPRVAAHVPDADVHACEG